MIAVGAVAAACNSADSEIADGGGGAASSSTGPTPPHHKSVTSGDDGGGGQGSEPTQPTAKIAELSWNVFRNQPFQLQDAGSSSPSGNVITYEWSQVSGAAVEIRDPHSFYQMLVAPDAIGPLVFQLVVFDGPLASEPATVTVDVVDRPPVAHAGADRGVLGAGPIMLAGVASDADNDPLNYSWNQVSGTPITIDDPSSPTPSLSVPAGLIGDVVFELVVDDGYEESTPDWVTLRPMNGADTDGDLLEDAVELSLGTDPTNPDSDGDGIPDGWEWVGHEGVDYQALGCDPRHLDLLVEMHVQQYTTGNVFHTAEPSPTLRSALAGFYASLPIANLDGTSGIALHLVDDSPLDKSFVCPDLVWAPTPPDSAPSNFLYRETFHKAEICLAAGQSSAEIGGRQLYVLWPEINSDPDDDLTEATVYSNYSIFIHEMGHNLGLHHGGDTDLNYKPNYPSAMNYDFIQGLDAASTSLETSSVSYSRGLMPDLDECHLVEQGILAGVPPQETAYLASYPTTGWTVMPDGSVDWNHDGSISTAPYSLVLRNSADPPDCSVLTDHDDISEIASHMASSLPADPNTVPPVDLIALPRTFELVP